MSAHEVLRRQASQLAEPGGDPYNTADRILREKNLAADFLRWLVEPIDGAVGDGHLRARQAE